MPDRRRDAPAPSHHTIFKVVSTRKGREVWSLVKILLLAVTLPVLLIWLGQAALCKVDHPKWATSRCFRVHPERER